MKRSSANQFPSLSPNETENLLDVLRVRFHKHMSRHADCTWELIEEALLAQPEKFWSIAEMERTGGEPDVIGQDEASGEYLFVDCSAESPKGRTATCYDREAQMSRKEHQPAHNAVDLAAAMGVSLLTEAEYFLLQTRGEFDVKTSSWIHTPEEIRQRGGALFGDCRYGRTFIYHNGAQSYYRNRGFRAMVRV
jgi:hypothetical protein